MGKILTLLHNHLFVILLIQLFAALVYQRVTGFDNLSKIAHLAHLLNRKAVLHHPRYLTKELDLYLS